MNKKLLLIVSHQDPGHMTGGQGVVLRNVAIEAARILRSPTSYLSIRLRDEPGYQEYEHGQIQVTRLAVSDSDVITTPYNGDEAAQFRRRCEFNVQAVHYIRSRFPPDASLVYLNGFYAEALLAKELPQYRTLSCFHVLLSRRMERTREKDPFYPQIVACEQQAIRASRVIQAISAGMGREIQSRVPVEERNVTHDKTRIIPNGVEEELLESPILGETVPNRILAWGRIAPEKGYEYLIAAVNHLPKSELLVFGRVDDFERQRGKYRSKLEQLAARNPRVRLDFRPNGVRGQERIALIDSASVVAVPSLYEPFGVVMLEALARGKPVVTTATAGARDIMRQRRTGANPFGFVLHLTDGRPNPRQLARAIDSTLNRLAAGGFSASMARERARSFHWDRITARILKTIEEGLS